MKWSHLGESFEVCDFTAFFRVHRHGTNTSTAAVHNVHPSDHDDRRERRQRSIHLRRPQRIADNSRRPGRSRSGLPQTVKRPDRCRGMIRTP